MKSIQITLSKLLIFIFLAGFQLQVKAQTPNSFPKDSIEFFETMNDYLSDARKEGKDFMKQFEAVWYGGYFSEKQREGVYEVSNKMLEKKLRAFPDFRNYLFTVGSFVVDENQSESSFEAWQEIIFKLLDERRKKNFTNFLEFCNGLFRDNAIYVSASTKWAASNNNYTFEYDSLPKLIFNELDLICYAKRDSMKIFDTKGTYYPTENLWVGHGGTVNWEKAGLLAEEVYAELTNYNVETNGADYEADSVTFYNSFYLDQGLQGKLTNKVLANITPENASYPRFDSYDRRIRIENISPGVNFDGGFAMVGPKLLGTGDEEQDAFLEFIRNDTLFLKAASDVFSIRTDKFISTQASIRIYFGQDSISHPGLNFKYLLDEKLVTLYKENSGVAITAYSNSYHNLEMDFEVLNWKTNEPIITLTNLLGGTKQDARFTSSDYYKKELFDKIGGNADVNPLFSFKRMVDKYGTTELSVEQLGYFMNMSPSDTKNMIIYYSTLGFLDFNFSTDQFFVKQKLLDYVAAYARKIDYDVININSVVDGAANAKINLLNYDLSIEGVRGIVLSDSQKVVILPSQGQVKMKKNRFFEFGGQVKAGRFDFYGQLFSFDYEKFKINLTQVDSLQIKAESGEKDQNGNEILKPVRTVIQDVNGDLLIDNFGNKSGLKDFPEYPIFNSKGNSYVYYDQKEVLDGIYKRGNFFFELDPFTIDSLDNFSNDQLKFEGTFTSAGIFPEFDEKLTLQQDFSLGFIRQTPPEGYPMYGGKGQFYDDINMSHDGLRGDGKLEYITSTTYSTDFIFYPDSMRTLADQYFIDEQKEGVEYPNVKAESMKMRWLPYDDILYATTTTKLGMGMYDDVSYFDGTSSYSPTEMRGNGIYRFELADLSSNQFVFKNMTFDSDTADFRLKDSSAAGTFALRTNNVNAHADYKERAVQFKANGKADPIEFPINQYICFMEEFKWYMDNGSIDLTSAKKSQVSADVSLEGSKFISTNPNQDSLFFYSPVATYDSRRHIIVAKDVQYMNSADALIYPDSGEVTIRKSAKMDALVNSRIEANSITKYHSVYNANTQVHGRKSYSSSGDIDYVDTEGNKQTIYLHNISVDTTGQTIGVGDIDKSTTFMLSPNFAFDGGVKLYGSKQFLVFDGATRINHNCEALGRYWIDFEAEVDPDEIFIPIDTVMRDTSGAFIASSINLNVDSVFLYSGFLSKRENYSDINVLPAYGFLHYDESSKQYRIGSKEKIQQNSLPGNYLSLDVPNCKVYGEGLVNIGADAGNVKFNAAGNINHSLLDNDAVFDLIMTIDFFFDDNTFKKMAEKINENINLKPVDFSRKTYEKGLNELLGAEEADEIISQLSLNGKIKRLPDELNKRFVFSDAKFKWNEDLNAYKSFGSLGLTNINKEEINKYVDGGIMITKKRSGDVVDIYIELDANNWYYFNYRRNLMKVISSNEDFNNQIKEMKRDDRRYDNKKGEEPFTYMFGTERDVRDFKRDFESDF
ncbi:MAG: hypothetical protein RJQ00_03900 [Vicingaceae bacterium]